MTIKTRNLVDVVVVDATKHGEEKVQRNQNREEENKKIKR
jgi:hypothetical protein